MHPGCSGSTGALERLVAAGFVQLPGVDPTYQLPWPTDPDEAALLARLCNQRAAHYQVCVRACTRVRLTGLRLTGPPSPLARLA